MLCDRNFAIGYVLPASAFLVVSLWIMNRFALLPNVFPLVEAHILLSIITISIASWVGGVGLLIMNRDIVRLLEGYGKFNPARFLFARIQKLRYERLRIEIFDLDRKYKQYVLDNMEFPLELLNKRSELMLK